MTEKPLIDLLDVDLAKIESVAIRRLLEEIRNNADDPNPRFYDRVYNRHNRS